MIADLHIHGRYSQGCSRNIDFDNLEKYARIKGVDLLGTGDFTHPSWLKEIDEKLKEENGVLRSKNGFPFLWQTELSLIYTQGGRGRRVHQVVLAPNREVVNQISDVLTKKAGRVLDYDGRPIFGFSSIELVDFMREISDKIEIIPAHCLLPDEPIFTNKGLLPISKLNTSLKVFTHKGKYQKIKETMKRKYNGKIFGFKTSCYNVPTYFTPEHPIYLIKSFKDCKNVPHTICKPACTYPKKRGCRTLEFKNYSPKWVKASMIEKGDIALFPIHKTIKDKHLLSLKNYLPLNFYLEGEYIKPRKEKIFKKNIGIKKEIKISKDFCRLIGYFLAEGYIVKDRIGFAFAEHETGYIEDVKSLLKNCFGNFINIQDIKSENKGFSFEIYSKILVEFFKSFYVDKPYKSYNKMLPLFFLDLPFEKQKEILIGWWRGDAGYTTSVNLINQMRTILLRLKIIPAINEISAESINKRRKFKSNLIDSRAIYAKNDCYFVSYLCFFDKNLELLGLDEFKKFKSKLDRRKGYFDDDYVYLPITQIEKKDYEGYVYNLEVEKDNSYVTKNLAVHNCWTSWFGVLGSKSGFDSVQDCFQEKVKHIHAVEMGLSSNPPMNWRISSLDKFNLVSFSDNHSFWPWRLARESTVFDCELSYENVLKGIRTGEGLKGTIGVPPNYGKYHWDGHRNCGVHLNPSESRKLKGICPVCKKPLTIGVEYRVEELADREEGFVRKDKKEFSDVIPLTEMIAYAENVKMLGGVKVWNVYNKLIEKFDNEYNILLKVPEEELVKIAGERLGKLILLNREMKLKIKPGYDGVYGEITEGEIERKEIKFENVQKSLDEF